MTKIQLYYEKMNKILLNKQLVICLLLSLSFILLWKARPKESLKHFDAQTVSFLLNAGKSFSEEGFIYHKFSPAVAQRENKTYDYYGNELYYTHYGRLPYLIAGVLWEAGIRTQSQFYAFQIFMAILVVLSFYFFSRELLGTASAAGLSFLFLFNKELLTLSSLGVIVDYSLHFLSLLYFLKYTKSNSWKDYSLGFLFIFLGINATFEHTLATQLFIHLYLIYIKVDWKKWFKVSFIWGLPALFGFITHLGLNYWVYSTWSAVYEDLFVSGYNVRAGASRLDAYMDLIAWMKNIFFPAFHYNIYIFIAYIGLFYLIFKFWNRFKKDVFLFGLIALSAVTYWIKFPAGTVTERLLHIYHWMPVYALSSFFALKICYFVFSLESKKMKYLSSVLAVVFIFHIGQNIAFTFYELAIKKRSDCHLQYEITRHLQLKFPDVDYVITDDGGLNRCLYFALPRDSFNLKTIQHAGATTKEQVLEQLKMNPKFNKALLLYVTKKNRFTTEDIEALKAVNVESVGTESLRF